MKQLKKQNNNKKEDPLGIALAEAKECVSAEYQLDEPIGPNNIHIVDKLIVKRQTYEAELNGKKVSEIYSIIHDLDTIIGTGRRSIFG